MVPRPIPATSLERAPTLGNASRCICQQRAVGRAPERPHSDTPARHLATHVSTTAHEGSARKRLPQNARQEIPVVAFRTAAKRRHRTATPAAAGEAAAAAAAAAAGAGTCAMGASMSAHGAAPSRPQPAAAVRARRSPRLGFTAARGPRAQCEPEGTRATHDRRANADRVSAIRPPRRLRIASSTHDRRRLHGSAPNRRQPQGTYSACC